jgi:hypothetical protein
MPTVNDLIQRQRAQQSILDLLEPARMNPNFAAQGVKSRDQRIAALASQSPTWSGEALPMEGRAAFLPFQDTLPGSVMNQRSLALPGVVAGAVNAFTAPGRAMQGGYKVDEDGNITPTFNAPEEAMNMATNVMGGGTAIGKAPAGSLGMNVTSRGRVPETARDVEKLADLLESRARSAGIPMISDKSRISPARYVQFSKPDGEPYNVRISDHLQVHSGNDISVDPSSMITFEDAIASLRENGIPIPNRVIPDKSLSGQANKAWNWSQYNSKERPSYRLGSQEYRAATDAANLLFQKEKEGTLTKQDINLFWETHKK